MKNIIIYWGRAAIVALFLLSPLSSCKSVDRSVVKNDSTEEIAKDIKVRTGRVFKDSTITYRKDAFELKFDLREINLDSALANKPQVDFDLLHELVRRSKEVTVTHSSFLKEQNNISIEEDSLYQDNSISMSNESTTERKIVRDPSFFASIGIVVFVFIVIFIILAFISRKLNGLIRF
jgi:Zn-dependent peptidase ImmA (M78 family)